MLETTINLIIALLLTIFALNRRDNTIDIIFSLFLYISLHYSYHIVYTFGTETFFYKYISSGQFSPIGVKAVGFSFLIFIGSLLLANSKSCILSDLNSLSRSYVFVYMLFLWIVVVTFYWAYQIFANSYFPTSLTIQNIVSNIVMIGLSLLIASAIINQTRSSQKIRFNFIYKIVFILAIIMDIFSLYQIINHRAYAIFMLDTGEYVRRACALLFNPNLLGIWFVFITVFASYFYKRKLISFYKLLRLFFLTVFGLLLSGSRSAFLICMFMLIFASLLLLVKKRKFFVIHYVPLVLFTSIMSGFLLFFKLIGIFVNTSFRGINELHVLSNRFLDIPGDIFAYGIFILQKNVSAIHDFIANYMDILYFDILINYLSNLSGKIRITSQSATSIAGRLKAENQLSDNGFITLYQDVGPIGFLVWSIIWGYIIFWGIHCFKSNDDINSVYTLTGIIACLFTGIFYRMFQVYPLWILVSIVIGLSLSWFRIALHKEKKLECP